MVACARRISLLLSKLMARFVNMRNRAKAITIGCGKETKKYSRTYEHSLAYWNFPSWEEEEEAQLGRYKAFLSRDRASIVFTC